MKRGLIIGATSEGGIGAYCLKWFAIDQRYSGLVNWYAPSPTLLDVSSDYSISEYIESAKTAEGSRGFDYVVYCAGLNELNWADDETVTQMQKIYAVNVFGFVSLLGQIRSMWPGKPFSAVAISSDAAHKAMRGSVTYCSSKAALDMAVKTMAREWAHEDFRVNAVAPGMVDMTPMSDYITETVPSFRGWTPEHARKYEKSMQPMGRRCTKAEVAHAVSDVLFGPTYLNGAVVQLTGAQ